jgi:hypothetical protein
MYKITRVLKWKVVIHNEIMIHFVFPKLIANNQEPYKDDEWKEVKTKHNLDKMIFSILNMKFNQDFYNKEMRLNPSNEAPLVGF